MRLEDSLGTGAGRRSDKSTRGKLRRYRAMPTASAVPTFHCGATAFHLDLLIAITSGGCSLVRPQEAHLLCILFESGGRVVPYDHLTKMLYGPRIPLGASRARLKSLVADIRRRFSDLQQLLLTAPGRGLVLQISGRALAERLTPCTSHPGASPRWNGTSPLASSCRKGGTVNSDRAGG
jgi:DNA-binding winged helix-turn-helix (wHTH) protein